MIPHIQGLLAFLAGSALKLTGIKRMIKKCFRFFVLLAALALVFGCTGAVYNLLKKDFGGELSLLKSSVGGRFAECEKALTAQHLCAEHFFKQKGCDYIDDFFTLRKEVFSNIQSYQNEALLYQRPPSAPDFDTTENKNLLKIMNERDRFCNKEIIQRSQVCNDANGNVQMELSSAIKTTLAKLERQITENLENHCE